MPNWCSTGYHIYDTPENLKVLNEAFDKAEESVIKNSFGDGWLGNILSHLGYTEDQILNGGISCRGSITFRSYDEGDDCMTIDTETAWGPMHEPIKLMLEKYAPEADVLFESTEPGMGYYVSNDPELVGAYLIDVWDDKGLPDELSGDDYWSVSGDKLRDMLREALDRPSGELGDMIPDIDDEYPDQMSINEWAYEDF